VDPDLTSAGQIAAAIHNARLVVGIEGSHLAHAIYAIADGGTLLAIQPPNRFNNVFKDIADAMALRYAFIVGAPVPGGFEVEVDRLDRLIATIATD
jgi:capsular polysaccharide biosynthesis protein